MRDGFLTTALVWALRLAIAGCMIAVENPFRLAAAALLLSLQIPVQARLAAWATVPARRGR